jgi:hypothetical protein
MTTKTVKISTIHGEDIILSNIEEYVCGYQYLYFRYDSSVNLTESYPRSAIVSVSRLQGNGEYRPIHLKKIKLGE